MSGLRTKRRLSLLAGVGAIAVLVVGVAVFALGWFEDVEPLPSFSQQACALPDEWLERIERGHYPGHSGDISILPRTPAYMASGAGGWSHSGPWEYLQEVPLVFYGPGIVDQGVEVDRPVTTADVVPTFAALVKGAVESDGTRLTEVADISGADLQKDRPSLVLTVVWDGGGWNSLDQWPDSHPVLTSLIEDGVSYTNATVGSSPSVTPSTHTTLGTGFFPDTHGISGIPVKDENGEVADSFLKGESAHFLQVPTFAERWDEQNENRAEVGMVGYEPWHLGMIGAGAERPGGDKDDAVWLDIETNEWTTNPEHFRLPPALVPAGGVQEALAEDIDALDAADGKVDGAWRDQAILDELDRLEETPAFISYHARAMMDLIEQDGYGDDEITDFLFTNFKQIDRVGHYFSMESDEVRDSIEATDEQLGEIVDFLDEEVGRGRYVVVVTADHGMQPDEEVTGGFGINPTELEADLKEEFGDVVRGVWPTEVFFFPEALEQGDVDVDEVARFIGDYRVEDNFTEDTGGTGSFDLDDRLFDMAIPADLLEGGLQC
ncbi:MAG: alkaline phosphatase family protein [Actinomycetota bacterium]|nr:alkaline phosphatase family protein [Actinomycetota bacterium]